VKKPRIRIKAPTRICGAGVPDDAQPGDLLVGNRGAAALVLSNSRGLYLEYVGNIRDGLKPYPGCKLYDRR
jgi:hypothetical protein